MSGPTRYRDLGALAVGPAAFGFTFGVVADTAGLPLTMVVAMSTFVYAGASQFAALGVLASGGSAAAAVATAMLINARFVPLGLAVAPKLQGGRLQKAVGAQLLVDPSAALAMGSSDSQQAHRDFWRGGLLLYGVWVATTLAGALAADVLVDPYALGLDAALPACFLAMVLPWMRRRAPRRAALAGAAIAIAVLPVGPASVSIGAATLGCLAAVGAMGRDGDPSAPGEGP